MSPGSLEISAAHLAKASLKVALRYQENLLATVRRLALLSVTVFALLSVLPTLEVISTPFLKKVVAPYLDSLVTPAPRSYRLLPSAQFKEIQLALAQLSGDHGAVWIVTLVAAAISAVLAGMFYGTLRLEQREKEVIEALEARQRIEAVWELQSQAQGVLAAELRDNLLKAIEDLQGVMPERIRKEIDVAEQSEA